MSKSVKIDPAWHKKQVQQYSKEQRRYRNYARILARILREAGKLYAPLSIVEAREKSIASFAEKTARKADKYRDPIHQITDLCGARIIVMTQDHAKAVCQFIREQFEIDEANSNDAGSRLSEREFGYQSVHFVVQVKRESILGVRVPLTEIGDRKAEIQVRTMLQHAWATITHDRLYKSDFKVPLRLSRLAHRIAALLEDADGAFNEFEHDIQAYLGNYSVYLKPEELAQELEIAELVLHEEQKPENKPALALRAARIAHAVGQLDRAIAALEKVTKVPRPLQLPIHVELGTALIEKFRDETDSAGFKKGQNFLRLAMGKSTDGCKIDECECPNCRKLRAAAAGALAASADKKTEACERYNDALLLDPDDPYILSSQLAFNLNHSNNRALIDSARPAILRAIEVCRSHVDAGLQLPQAWFTMGQLHLLLRQDAAALDHFSKGIHFYLADDKLVWRKQESDEETNFFERIQLQNHAHQPEIEWAEHLTELGRWLKNGRQGPLSRAMRRPVKYTGFKAGQKILIIAGGTAAEVQAKMDTYYGLLKTALDGFQGIVISGGTDAGIPGVLARAALALKKVGRKTFTLIGYHPQYLRPAKGYDQLIPSGEQEALGLDEPPQVWLDLLSADIQPSAVRLLGINGGRISRFEYSLALAVGATVGLIQSSGRSADQVLNDPDWSKLPTLLPLPDDPFTAQAFAQVGAHPIPKGRLERMARKIHEIYLHKRSQEDTRQGTTIDPDDRSRWPWEILPPELKQSNYAQAEHAPVILQKVGCRIAVQRSGKVEPTAPARFLQRKTKLMAEMEHGRWNFERLSAGWRYASQKNSKTKRSPFLVSWKKLPRETAVYDIEAVKCFPEVLAAGGYSIKR